MNFGICKTGRIIYFDPHKWYYGDNETALFTLWMALNYPEHNFYLLSKSDFTEIFGNSIKNIIPLDYVEFGCNINEDWIEQENKIFDKYVEHLTNKFKNIELSHIFKFRGIMHSFTQPGTYNNGKLMRPSICGLRYSSQIIDLINSTNIPFSVIITDIRHVRFPNRNVIRKPEHILGQGNCTYSYKEDKKIRIWKDQTVELDPFITMEYAGIESFVLLGQNINKDFYSKNYQEKTEFNIAHNHFGMCCSNPDNFPRYKNLLKYGIFDLENVSIYGEWPEQLTKRHQQFKGQVPMIELENKFKNTKYTMLLGRGRGDDTLTCKFLEMCSFGVIPFVDSEYGTSVPNNYIDPFFIVKDAQDLKDKIKELDSRTFYHEILDKIHKMLYYDHSFYDGGFLWENFQRIESFPKTPLKLNKFSQYYYKFLKKKNLSEFL